jgi:hypothetical protein
MQQVVWNYSQRPGDFCVQARQERWNRSGTIGCHRVVIYGRVRKRLRAFSHRNSSQEMGRLLLTQLLNRCNVSRLLRGRGGSVTVDSTLADDQYTLSQLTWRMSDSCSSSEVHPSLSGGEEQSHCGLCVGYSSLLWSLVVLLIGYPVDCSLLVGSISPWTCSHPDIVRYCAHCRPEASDY